MAMATASAAESAARTSEAISAPRQAPSVKISPYQASEKPCGGNSRVFFSFSETPPTTTSGARRKSAISVM